jgi:hypothetical protein
VTSVAKPARSLVWVQGLICGGLAAWLPGTATLGAIMLAPGLIAYLTDRSPSRPVGRAVLFFGATIAPHSLIALWHAGNSVATSLAMAGDMRRVAAAWAIQAGGWLLAELAPLAARLLLEAKAQARIAILRRRRVRLEDEWGLAPRADAGDRPMAPDAA